MTEYVNPSNNFRPKSEEMGRVFRYAGHTPAFIADTTTTLVSDIDSVGVTAGPLGAFAKASETGLDFVVDTGEAMIQGALLAKDTQTTVTLPASSSGTIYLAWDPSVENGLIIDYDGSGNVSGIPRTALYDFTTDTSNVTGQTDQRNVGEDISVQNNRYEGGGVSVDQADNSSKLGGVGPSAYGRLAQNESVNGTWTFNSSIDMASTDVNAVNAANSPANQAALLLGAGLVDISLTTGGGGNGTARIYDNANSQPIADFNEGGGVKFLNGDLETRRGWMVDHSSPISIEKNGTDGQGVINFKTQ